MITKIIEKGVQIAVTTALTAGCAALTYAFLSDNKNANEDHKRRMALLEDEYNAKVAANNAAANQ
jgi:hypothetical protein